MRVLGLLFLLLFAGMVFALSFIGTRLSMHKDVLPRTNQYARMFDDIVYGIVVALPASLPDHIQLPLPRWTMPRITFVMPHIISAAQTVPQTYVPASPAATMQVDDLEPVATHRPMPQRKRERYIEPPSSLPLAQMFRAALAREDEVIFANVSAAHGGLLRFNDGSSLVIGPHTLPHDVAIQAALSAPASAEATNLVPASEAMVLSFRPIADDLAYAQPAQVPLGAAFAAITLTGEQRRYIGARAAIVVMRVYDRNGSSRVVTQAKQRMRGSVRGNLRAGRLIEALTQNRATVVISGQIAK